MKYSHSTVQFIGGDDILQSMLDRLDFATNLAREAGELLVDYSQSADFAGNLKADRSMVTEADVSSDHLITQAIQKFSPTDMVLSEELNTIFFEDNAKVIWVVDPLDGTTNFSLGLPIWGVLLTLLENSYPVMAVMYFPLLNELYIAQQGGGAYLNGRQISVQSRFSALPLSFFACCSRTFRQFHVDVPYKVRILGSAAYTFCSLARGAALVAFEATPKIWDIAGAWLLIKEAGGVIDTMDNRQPFPLLHGVDYATQSFPTLGAATSALWKNSRRQIRPKEE